MSTGFAGIGDRSISTLPETVTAQDIAVWLGVNRTTIYRYVSLGDFPKPVKLSPRRQVFLKSEVLTWFKDKQGVDLTIEPLSELETLPQ